MTEPIDYEVLYNRVIAENEALRLGMFRARMQQNVPLSSRLARARDFIEDNYLVLVFALIVLSTLCSGVYVLWRDREE